MKKTYRCVSIKSMKYFVYNKEKKKYECKGWYGKTPQEMSEEHGDISKARIRQYAYENKLPYFGTDNETFFYIFDPESEEAFINRPKQGKHNKYKDRPLKSPKVPGKPGRSRKSPTEVLDIVPKPKKGVKPKRRK